MGSLGVPELIVIFVVALIFFGPKKLPELGRSLGKGLNEFKKASNELRATLDEEIRLDERRQSQPPVQSQRMPAPPTIDVPAQPAHMPEPAGLPAATDTLAQPDPLAQPDTVARGQHGS